MSDSEPPIHRPLEGLRGLVLGVANEHSIAWGCTRVVLTCLNEKSVPYVVPLAERIGAPLLRCNVEEPGELQAAIHAAAEHLGGRGALATMSYIGADEAVPHYGLMGPVKAALESLVRYMAVEPGPKNVRLHAVSPGPVPTRAASGLLAFDEPMTRSAQTAPLRRLVTLDEIGRCVAFPVGPDASGMTGQTLYVDAGDHAVR